MESGKSTTLFLAVRAIIRNEQGKILFLKRALQTGNGGQWCLPGGKVEAGLTVVKNLLKEVSEETGLHCQSIRFLFYQDNLPSKPGEAHYVTLYFECETEGKITLNHESSDFVWLAVNELKNMDIAFQNDLAVKQYFRYLKRRK